jgi:putative superfamily III holin-X
MSALDQRPASELFSDALSQLSRLIRNELELARAEMAQKANKVMSGTSLLVAAALFAIPALVLLLAALAAWLQDLGWNAALSNLAAGVVGLLIAFILGGIGLARLKADTLVPQRTLHQLQQDAIAAKEHV